MDHEWRDGPNTSNSTNLNDYDDFCKHLVSIEKARKLH